MRSMKCVIPPNRMKGKRHLISTSLANRLIAPLVLAKAAQSLAKYSAEVFVECMPDAFVLSAVNASQTCYSKFTFRKCFFSDYAISGSADGDKASFACKMYVRCLRVVFKRRAEKKVKTCKILLEEDADDIVLRVKYMTDAIMYHTFHIIAWESMSLHSAHDATTTNVIKATKGVFASILRNFYCINEKMIMSALMDRMVLRNYVPNPQTFHGIRSTGNLQTGEFYEYQIAEESDVLFMVKPFKSLLRFADALMLNVSVHFSIGGSPMTVSTRSGCEEYEGIAVISTSAGSSEESQPAGREDAALTQADRTFLQSINWDEDDFPATDVAAHTGATDSSEIENPAKRLKNSSPSPDPSSFTLTKVRDVFGVCFERTMQSQGCFGPVIVARSDSEDDDDED